MGIRGILGGVVVLAALLLVATFVFGLGRRSRPKLALVLVLAVAGYVLWPSGSVPDGPSVAVVASADGGWDVTVAEVPTATDYRLVVDDGRAVSLAGPGTWNVVPPDPKNGEYRPGPVHEATLTALRDGQPVARSAVTFCAPVVLVSARGTWQTPGDTDFSQGIGSRGWGTWQALARSLGVQSDRPGAHPTVVDAIGVRYPATGIPLVDDDSYATSRNEGKKSLRTLLTQISGSCPDSRVVLLGYSQGADVVASVWQDDAPGELRRPASSCLRTRTSTRSGWAKESSFRRAVPTRRTACSEPARCSTTTSWTGSRRGAGPPTRSARSSTGPGVGTGLPTTATKTMRRCGLPPIFTPGCASRAGT